ncbi:MAG TPA: 2Fe-2S iron-sulfur cluster-binding protein [Candidatus Nanoarchaeia archaeon]|nr:2Fe-2S iron-sulfur cluster-binding protein [Candidatus Nanoarchaeia archaeon]
MAKIVLDDQEREVADGDQIKDACKDLGIAFGCEDGVCGTCLVEVDEGMENLTEPSEAEKNMGIEGNNRLCCQCKIKGGTVKLKY